MAVTPPPDGFGYFVDTWHEQDSLRTASCVIGFRNTSGGTAAGCLATVSSVLHGATGPFKAAFLSSEWTLIQQYVLVNLGGVLQSDVVSPAQDGTGSFDTPPPNVSLIVRKNTLIAGRQYRGRVAMPAGFIDEANVSGAGVLDSGDVTTMQNAWDAAFTGLQLASVPAYLLHQAPQSGPTPAPTSLSSFSVQSLVGTQRRRLRR